MNLEISQHNDLLLIAVTEARIDAAVALQFKDRFREACATPSRRVVLDLARVDFVDSSGLGAIVAALKMMESGRRLELAGLTPPVERVLRLTRMDRVFVIHKDAETALSLRDAA